MQSIQRVPQLIYATKKYPSFSQTRFLWEYVNMMFNKPDPKRIELVGPDRACAEWVLRNGGTVTWENTSKTTDYNSLPLDNVKVPKLIAIDGSNSGISHYGFAHLSGCVKLNKIILHNNTYIDDRAMKGLEHGKETLMHVQVSSCNNVSDNGVKELLLLKKLETLILFDLGGVNDLNECRQYLESQLPKCKIQGKVE